MNQTIPQQPYTGQRADRYTAAAVAAVTTTGKTWGWLA